MHVVVDITVIICIFWHVIGVTSFIVIVLLTLISTSVLYPCSKVWHGLYRSRRIIIDKNSVIARLAAEWWPGENKKRMINLVMEIVGDSSD